MRKPFKNHVFRLFGLLMAPILLLLGACDPAEVEDNQIIAVNFDNPSPIQFRVKIDDKYLLTLNGNEYVKNFPLTTGPHHFYIDNDLGGLVWDTTITVKNVNPGNGADAFLNIAATNYVIEWSSIMSPYDTAGKPDPGSVPEDQIHVLVKDTFYGGMKHIQPRDFLVYADEYDLDIQDWQTNMVLEKENGEDIRTLMRWFDFRAIYYLNRGGDPSEFYVFPITVVEFDPVAGDIQSVKSFQYGELQAVNYEKGSGKTFTEEFAKRYPSKISWDQ